MLNQDRHRKDSSNNPNTDALSKLDNEASISNFNFSNKKACNDMAISKLPWLINTRQDDRGFIFEHNSNRHRCINLHMHLHSMPFVASCKALDAWIRG